MNIFTDLIALVPMSSVSIHVKLFEMLRHFLLCSVGLGIDPQG